MSIISADYFLLCVLCMVSVACLLVAVTASLHCRSAGPAPPSYTAEASLMDSAGSRQDGDGAEEFV